MEQSGGTKKAGRIKPEHSLNLQEWKSFAAGAEDVAAAVLNETGLRTVFHHHCAGFIETHDEIATLLELTDPKSFGLVFDTGHYTYGSGGADAVAALDSSATASVHPPEGLPRGGRPGARQWLGLHRALRHGVFCELGKARSTSRAFLRKWLHGTTGVHVG